MKKDRRDFLKSSMALGLITLSSPSFVGAMSHLAEADKKLKILILGGTSFLGPHQIAYALGRGHQVTTFTRGKTMPKLHAELFEKVEKLIGDREDNLEALKGRKWDVVIDNSGRRTQWTRDTAELLVDNVDLYMYTSSISVYYPFTGEDFTEGRKLVTKIPEGIGADERSTYQYGVMKATSEMATIDVFGEDRSIIVRPTLIVGPGDRTDRFPSWVARLERGGDVIIPGSREELVQYIDVRDLAQWMIRLLENRAVGIYNGSGPGFAMTTNAFVHGVHASFASSVNYVQIDDQDFLLENGITGMQPWVIQLPQYAGMSRSDNSRAIEADLTFRPLSETVKDTWDWWSSEAVSSERRENLWTREGTIISRERDILAKWKNWR